MNNDTLKPIYSGATTSQVAEDLKPFVNFQDKGLSIEELTKLLEKKTASPFNEL